MGYTDQSKQKAASVNKTSSVCHEIPWNSTRRYRPETFVAHSPRDQNVVSTRVSAPIWQKKVVGKQGIAKCLNTFSKAVVVIDITGVVSV